MLFSEWESLLQLLLLLQSNMQYFQLLHDLWDSFDTSPWYHLLHDWSHSLLLGQSLYGKYSISHSHSQLTLFNQLSSAICRLSCWQVMWQPIPMVLAPVHGWTGEGLSNRPPIDMYSGLTDTYGVYTVLSFLQNYIQYFPLSTLCRPPIHANCDNNGLIKSLSNTNKWAYLCGTIKDDYPIYTEIRHIVQILQPLTI